MALRSWPSAGAPVHKRRGEAWTATAPMAQRALWLAAHGVTTQVQYAIEQAWTEKAPAPVSRIAELLQYTGERNLTAEVERLTAQLDEVMNERSTLSRTLRRAEDELEKLRPEAFEAATFKNENELLRQQLRHMEAEQRESARVLSLEVSARRRLEERFGNPLNSESGGDLRPLFSSTSVQTDEAEAPGLPAGARPGLPPSQDSSAHFYTDDDWRAFASPQQQVSPPKSRPVLRRQRSSQGGFDFVVEGPQAAESSQLPATPDEPALETEETRSSSPERAEAAPKLLRMETSGFSFMYESFDYDGFDHDGKQPPEEAAATEQHGDGPTQMPEEEPARVAAQAPEEAPEPYGERPSTASQAAGQALLAAPVQFDASPGFGGGFDFMVQRGSVVHVDSPPRDNEEQQEAEEPEERKEPPAQPLVLQRSNSGFNFLMQQGEKPRAPSPPPQISMAPIPTPARPAPPPHDALGAAEDHLALMEFSAMRIQALHRGNHTRRQLLDEQEVDQDEQEEEDEEAAYFGYNEEEPSSEAPPPPPDYKYNVEYDSEPGYE